MCTSLKRLHTLWFHHHQHQFCKLYNPPSSLSRQYSHLLTPLNYPTRPQYTHITKVFIMIFQHPVTSSMVIVERLLLSERCSLSCVIGTSYDNAEEKLISYPPSTDFLSFKHSARLKHVCVKRCLHLIFQKSVEVSNVPRKEDKRHWTRVQGKCQDGTMCTVNLAERLSGTFDVKYGLVGDYPRGGDLGECCWPRGWKMIPP